MDVEVGGQGCQRHCEGVLVAVPKLPNGKPDLRALKDKAAKQVGGEVELFLVSLDGNDQDLFGFIWLGAYQGARPEKEGAKPRVKLVWGLLHDGAPHPAAAALPVRQLGLTDVLER